MRNRFKLVAYTEPDVIRARLVVLYEKADRIVRFSASCSAGAPDPSLLDEKQQLILAGLSPRLSARRWACRYRRTLGLTIDILESRLRDIERRERRADRAAERLERRFA